MERQGDHCFFGLAFVGEWAQAGESQADWCRAHCFQKWMSTPKSRIARSDVCGHRSHWIVSRDRLTWPSSRLWPLRNKFVIEVSSLCRRPPEGSSEEEKLSCTVALVWEPVRIAQSLNLNVCRETMASDVEPVGIRGTRTKKGWEKKMKRKDQGRQW